MFFYPLSFLSGSKTSRFQLSQGGGPDSLSLTSDWPSRPSLPGSSRILLLEKTVQRQKSESQFSPTRRGLLTEVSTFSGFSAPSSIDPQPESVNGVAQQLIRLILKLFCGSKLRLIGLEDLLAPLSALVSLRTRMRAAVPSARPGAS